MVGKRYRILETTPMFGTSIHSEHVDRDDAFHELGYLTGFNRGVQSVSSVAHPPIVEMQVKANEYAEWEAMD